MEKNHPFNQARQLFRASAFLVMSSATTVTELRVSWGLDHDSMVAKAVPPPHTTEQPVGGLEKTSLGPLALSPRQTIAAMLNTKATRGHGSTAYAQRRANGPMHILSNIWHCLAQTKKSPFEHFLFTVLFLMQICQQENTPPRIIRKSMVI